MPGTFKAFLLCCTRITGTIIANRFKNVVNSHIDRLIASVHLFTNAISSQFCALCSSNPISLGYISLYWCCPLYGLVVFTGRCIYNFIHPDCTFFYLAHGCVISNCMINVFLNLLMSSLKMKSICFPFWVIVNAGFD